MSSLIKLTADDLDVFLSTCHPIYQHEFINYCRRLGYLSWLSTCHPVYQREFIDYCRRLGCLSFHVSSRLPTSVHWILQTTWLYFFPNVIPSTNMSSLVTADDLDIFLVFPRVIPSTNMSSLITADDLDVFLSTCHPVYQQEFIEYCRRLGCISFQMSYHLPTWVHWLLQTTWMSFWSFHVSSRLPTWVHWLLQTTWMSFWSFHVSSRLPTWVHWLLQTTWMSF